MLGHASHKSGDEQKRIALDTGAAMILAANRVSSPQIYAESDLSLDSNDVADSQEDFMNDQSKFAKQLKDLLLNSTDEAVKQNVIDRKLLELWDEFRTPVWASRFPPLSHKANGHPPNTKIINLVLVKYS